MKVVFGCQERSRGSWIERGFQRTVADEVCLTKRGIQALKWDANGQHLVAQCGFRTMSISIPKRCRSGLRADADHDSDAMPITNCAGIGTVIGTS